jgi:hypothetical protein
MKIEVNTTLEILKDHPSVHEVLSSSVTKPQLLQGCEIRWPSEQQFTFNHGQESAVHNHMEQIQCWNRQTKPFCVCVCVFVFVFVCIHTHLWTDLLLYIHTVINVIILFDRNFELKKTARLQKELRVIRQCRPCFLSQDIYKLYL